jgi:hypothetical protein
MMQNLKTLNAEGIALFKEFLDRIRNGSTEAPPFNLLNDDTFSEPIEAEIKLTPQTFSDRYELGCYLTQVLAPLDRYRISRDHSLWNWLTLFYFDVISKKEADGSRKLLREELYILGSKYDYLRYYKHLVRTPWLAVLDHKEHAKVLFVNSRGTRSDIEETLTASQQVLGNKTIIAAAYKLYFDQKLLKPKRGAAGKSGGSPRRLTSFIQQLTLTYDIHSCSAEQFMQLLPAEFEKFNKSTFVVK